MFLNLPYCINIYSFGHKHGSLERNIDFLSVLPKVPSSHLCGITFLFHGSVFFGYAKRLSVCFQGFQGTLGHQGPESPAGRRCIPMK